MAFERLTIWSSPAGDGDRERLAPCSTGGRGANETRARKPSNRHPPASSRRSRRRQRPNITRPPPQRSLSLKAAYAKAAIYFPFSDVVVADPYKDLSEGLKVAFYIGQSKVIGGVTTDMVAYGNDAVFIQVWIGAEDKLPRMLRAVFSSDPTMLRHEMLLSDWQIDPSFPPGTFTLDKANSAKRIAFARPDPWAPNRFAPPPKSVRYKKQ